MRGEKAPPAPSAAVTKGGPSEAPKAQAALAPAAAAAVSAVVLQDVHFDFDRYLVRPQDAEILKQDFSWLKANPTRRVRVEGNCDERGTVEYNLALGQKRADAAKNYLVTLGTDAKLLDTVSYGKERPLDPGHNEAAWAKNRRAHLEPAK
jgi:peptidoglycan-associated lipoprotein